MTELEQDPALTEAAQVGKWQERITISKKWRDGIAEREGWERFIREYEGEYDVYLANMQVPPINEVYAFCDTSLATLYSRNPYLAVNPTKNSTIQSAKIFEVAINYYWRLLDIKDENETEIIDANVIGHGWNKVGTFVETSGENETLQVGEPKIFSSRVSWRDIFFNINSKNPPKDCMWMAHRVLLPTEFVRKAFDAPDIKGSSYPDIEERTYKNSAYKDDIEFTYVYEIWDKEKREKIWIADNYKKFLKPSVPWEDWRTEFPFQMLFWTRVPDKAYPMSAIKPWENQLLEKIKLVAMALNHVKRWNRQLLIKKGFMDEDEKNKFEKGWDGSAIEVNGNPQTDQAPLVYAPLPPDIYTIIDRLDSIIRSTNGQPEIDRGSLTQTKTRTLGELTLVKEGARSRTDRKIDRLETHLANIARALMKEMQNNFDVEQIVKITGDTPDEVIQALSESGHYDPETRTIRFTKEDIQGEYDVIVKAGSTLPLDKSTRIQILQDVLAKTAELAAAPSLPPFIKTVISELLADYDIKSLEEAFEKQEESVDVQRQQDNAMQNAQTEKVQAEAQRKKAQAMQMGVDTTIKTVTAAGKASGEIPLDAKVGV